MQIPPMTHELSKYWGQPDVSQILVDDCYAVMNQATFNALADYSLSNPSGVYEGKCWKRRQGNYWLLCFYGPSHEPTLCSINALAILIA